MTSGQILRLTAQNDKRAIRESPLQPVGNGLDRSVIHSKSRGGSKILRIRAPFCLLRRHFPYQGNHPALPCKLYFVRVGNGLDRSVKLYQITRANTVRPYE